ncbi:uncharacterized protein B0P05DRAFT_166085 [Gilbertella persicaria]|uniref:uncharacterized protein n=1 Tax=Gilbertella persicaria TaxID=101096 RepID=UPI002221169D|nr:uncharacterized protein B0P05DRAFT_166085 [Gilbertella persicaria]KAI8094869.1 hypothetical protein B0P05DRAFT_166085 [Gilbertella persicaria]
MVPFDSLTRKNKSYYTRLIIHVHYQISCCVSKIQRQLFFLLFLSRKTMPALDIRGCLEDSPNFRKRIQSHEESIQNFEQSLKTLIKLTRSQVDLSIAYSQQQNQLAHEFMSFAHAQDDPIVGKP